jgi:RNA polymerase sigma factor (sigma-70 family)
MAVRDETAFHDFVAARSASLFRTALLMVGDHQLAQDLRDVHNAEAYARRVVVTTSISWRRRRSSHERPVEVLPEAAGVADLADRVAGRADLWTQLQTLPSRQRAAVALRYCEDLSEAQTAELMGCSVGSVKKHASLGLGKLRDRLGARITLPTPDEPAVTS